MTTLKAHPDDILVARDLSEAQEYHPTFDQSQLFTCSMPGRLNGRRFRKAWLSELFWEHRDAVSVFGKLRNNARATGNADNVLGIALWRSEPAVEPEEIDLGALIAALPAKNATSGRDYGRGYAHAVRDVLALIAEVA